MFFKTLKVYFKTAVTLLAITPKLKTADEIREKEGLIEGNSYASSLANKWAKGVWDSIGSNVVIDGLDNIPKDRNFLLIANHRSNMDLFAVLATIDRPIGFVAKAELGKLPIVKKWIPQIGCLLMDRKDMRQSMQTILEGIKLLKAGHNLAIFPEGTRTSGRMLEFKGGSFKLATKSGVPILPLSIEGTEYIFEENHGWIEPAEIHLTYHPIIETKGMSKEEQNELPHRVQTLIGSALKEEYRYGEDENTDC